MATSSIGKTVKLDSDTARRFAAICAEPAKKAKGSDGPMRLFRDKGVLDRVR